MKTRFYIITLLAFALMFSCNQVPDSPLGKTAPPEEPKEDTLTVGLNPDTVDISHCILSFVQPKSFAAKEFSGGGGISISFEAQHYNGYEDTDIQQYTALCEQYGDATYNQLRIFPAAEDKGFSYLVDNIVSIDVVTETNYNAEHPAGSSLNDICVLEAESPYKHIKSGYTLTHEWPKPEVGQRQKDKGSIPFSKPLDECTAEDMILMGNGFYSLCKIKLEKMPTVGSKQLLTITLTDETGKVYALTTEPFTW